ncbi:hypothetical protein Hypma_009410 [Hypsizygus marmoreus]|uniref:Uncharacterized protein n=1 Tax=Hypsizygus marmoreus TaxID=39966 RepID=A0A369JUL0_HYPMA|nr:hypothetical protein Hypma_009410 [Hypsizygus marmoreus]
MASLTSPHIATASQLAPSHAPILSAGIITYDNFKIFEKMCFRFFSHKSIAPEDQVQRIIYNFEDVSVQDWLEADFDKFAALTFPNFATEFMKKWLPTYWEDDIINRVIRMQDNRPFWTWVIDVKKCNLLLVNKPLHVAANTMKAHLTARFDTSLRNAYRSADNFDAMEAMPIFDTWVDEVRKIDDRIRARSERNGKAYIDKLVAQSVAARMPLNANIADTVSTPHQSTTTVPSTSTTRPPRPFIPRLTEAEKLLLASNGGCYKCRLFYAGHYADSCTVERPSPDAVKNLTPENAALAKSEHEHRKPAVIAAVFGSEPATFVDDTYSYDDPAMDEDYAPEYGVDEYVPSFTDSLPTHFWWDCSLDAPFTCAPTPVRALIDSGACPVMISSEMAEIHGLVPRRLHKPYLVSGALSSSPTSSTCATSSLTTYCKLHLQSRDARWKSRVVHAIIVPNLVTDIILGLDFLVRNKIVLDPECRTAIAKDSSFDLLNPPDASLFRTPITRSPPQIRKADAALARAEAEKIRAARKIWRPVRASVHAELLLFFQKHPVRFDLQAHTTGSAHIVGLVRSRIEQLASLDALSALDRELKTTFIDCFPTDIPHDITFQHAALRPTLPKLSVS